MDELLKNLYAHRDPEQAVSMAAYMKEQFPFLGISKPERARLEKGFIKEVKRHQKVDWGMVGALWDLPEREFQYVAVDYLLALQQSLAAADIERIRALIVSKSWWDTVDMLAARVVGPLCARHPALVESHMLPWADSDNIWLARTAILYPLHYKEATDPEVLQQIILKNTGSREFFINKAIGWVLRQYSKTDPQWVGQFLQTHQLAPLSVREAGKYL